MVQKYQSPVRVYKYPFELVMRAYEMRFPTCDMIPIVRETEVLEEVVDDATGIHMIDRRAKVRYFVCLFRIGYIKDCKQFYPSIDKINRINI